MLHHIATWKRGTVTILLQGSKVKFTYKRSSPTKACLAVNGNGTRCGLADVKEPPQDRLRGCRAVYEEEVLVLEACVGESLAIVDLLVQPHNASDIVKPEIGEVGFWGVERVSVLDLAVGMWPAERQELLWDQPVEISILHFFVVLVFIVVKVVKLKETLKFQYIVSVSKHSQPISNVITHQLVELEKRL